MAIKAQATITLSRVDDGSDGIGVKSTDITYQAASSQTSAPTGDWLSKVPELTPKTPYLWTRTVITYTDGKTSTSYSVSSTIDGVVVGGRNLIRNSDFKSNTNWNSHGITGTDTRLGYGVEEGRSYLLISGENHDMSKGRFGVYSDDNLVIKKVSADDSLTISAWVYVEKALASTNDNEIFVRQAGYIDNLELKIPSTTPINTWVHLSQTYVYTKSTELTNVYILLGGDGSIRVSNLKLERGNKATDWSPAPEDIDQSIQDVEDTANKAESDSSNALGQTVEIKASLEVLEGSIKALVTDENGNSLMTQTGDGWTFNMGNIQSALNKATEDIIDVKGEMNEVSDLANKTNQLANDIAEKTAYINMTTDESGAPCMELGKSDSEFKLRITNTSIDFLQGSQRIAYITNQQLYIQSSVVTDEMRIGSPDGFVWKKRSSGNMGLRWIGG